MFDMNKFRGRFTNSNARTKHEHISSEEIEYANFNACTHVSTSLEVFYAGTSFRNDAGIEMVGAVEDRVCCSGETIMFRSYVVVNTQRLIHCVCCTGNRSLNT